MILIPEKMGLLGSTPRSADREVPRSSRATPSMPSMQVAQLEYKDVPDLSDIFVATTH